VSVCRQMAIVSERIKSSARGRCSVRCLRSPESEAAQNSLMCSERPGADRGLKPDEPSCTAGANMYQCSTATVDGRNRPAQNMVQPLNL
jgi:hypothetical protein